MICGLSYIVMFIICVVFSTFGFAVYGKLPSPALGARIFDTPCTTRALPNSLRALLDIDHKFGELAFSSLAL